MDMAYILDHLGRIHPAETNLRFLSLNNIIKKTSLCFSIFDQVYNCFSAVIDRGVNNE